MRDTTNTSARPRAAYQLRAGGTPWRQIALRLDYADHKSAKDNVYSWRRTHGLPRPAVKE